MKMFSLYIYRCCNTLRGINSCALNTLSVVNLVFRNKSNNVSKKKWKVIMWGEICADMMVPIELCSQFLNFPQIPPSTVICISFPEWKRMRPVETKTGNVINLMAVFNNMRTLKFKAQLTIGFFPAVNQKNKMNRNLLITTDRRDLLTRLKWASVSREVRLDDWRQRKT